MYRRVQVGLRGFERRTDSSGKVDNLELRAAKSGAVDAQNTVTDPRLEAVVEAWPELPEDVKADIMSLVRSVP